MRPKEKRGRPVGNLLQLNLQKMVVGARVGVWELKKMG